MKRKLVKQGAATLMISLPAKWLKRFKLGKGDEIDVDEEGSRLVISKKGAKVGKETEINLTRQTETGIRTLITNAYRSGFDVVNVKFENEEHVPDIAKELKISEEEVKRIITNERIKERVMKDFGNWWDFYTIAYDCGIPVEEVRN